MNPKIMIVAGEMSGDVHGASLVKEMRRLSPTVSFSGMGGPCLQAEGVEILYDAAKLAVVGIAEVVSHLRDIYKARTRLLATMRAGKPDLLILIDFPDFNLSLAKKAKRLGIPVFYYISPQVWAWRSGRVKQIKSLVDKMAVILPFEKEFYRQRGIEVGFVGHPLLDQVKVSSSPSQFRAKYGIPAHKTMIGVLPGSRKKEITAILPTLLQAAQRLYAIKSEVVFLLPLAPSLQIEDLRGVDLTNDLPLQVIRGDRYDLMAHCDLAMAASGTVTLELAIVGTPMVVAYRVSPLTYWLGRRLIKVKFASLVNLVAKREIVRELLQDDCTPANLTDTLLTMWPGTAANEKIQAGLLEVCGQLGGQGASRRAAELALATISSE